MTPWVSRESTPGRVTRLGPADGKEILKGTFVISLWPVMDSLVLVHIELAEVQSQAV